MGLPIYGTIHSYSPGFKPKNIQVHFFINKGKSSEIGKELFLKDLYTREHRSGEFAFTTCDILHNNSQSENQ